MDFSHHEFTDGNIWDPYNPTMENHILGHPFDLTQCPNHPLIHHNLREPSNNSSSDHLLAASSKLLEGTNFELGENQEEEEGPEEELGSMKEMMFKVAAMQPVEDIDPATIRRPKRRNVRLSNDPQSVAARHRRERISEKMRILQRLVPGGMTMDTASMLDEAAKYVKFLKRQIRILGGQNHHQQPPCTEATITTPSAVLDLVALNTVGGASSYLFGGNNNGSGLGGEYPSICSNPN
ncbi:uncharacterized protein [Primulina huaijiensis]|uniref:uncharacterized protein n=1 Tax=Primulina huaijiensis TaxID=1492673 RepID=UPI003CC797BC